jgi:hypothetical protein
LAGQQPFTALITYAGKSSDNFVNGTEGVNGGPYKVMIPAEVLKRKIKELEGKRVFASEDLSSHQRPKFIGEFVSAWTEELGNDLVAAKASGVLYRHTDPTLVDQIIALSRQGQMGFSYDLKDVQYELKHSTTGDDGKELSAGSGTPYMELVDFSWRGATILKREAAAYLETALAASKIDKDTKTTQGEDEMEKAEILKAVGEGMQAALGDLKAELISAAIDPLRTELTASIAEIKNEVTELKGKQAEFAANAQKKDDKSGEAQGDKGGDKTGTTLAASDIAAAMKEAVSETFGQLAEAVEDLKSTLAQKEEERGFRKSLAASQLDVLKKYGGVEDEGEGITTEHFDRAIGMVQTDIRLGKDAKLRKLAELGAAKRELIHAQQGGRT